MVSGLSSGGFFAHQFHVVFSSTVGAPTLPVALRGQEVTDPVLAAQASSIRRALAGRHGHLRAGLGSRPDPPSPRMREADRRRTAVGMTSTIPRSRPMIGCGYCGEPDEVVPAAVTEESLPTSIAVSASTTTRSPPALWIRSARPTAACRWRASPARAGMRGDQADHALPFVIECGYDAAELPGIILKASFRAGRPVRRRQPARLRPDRVSAVADGRSERCRLYLHSRRPPNRDCRLHVAFHGCRRNADAQGDERVHDDFVRDAGRPIAGPGRTFGSSSSPRDRSQQAIRALQGLLGLQRRRMADARGGCRCAPQPPSS